MQDRKDSDSRKLLRRLKEILAAAGDGQDRLDQITHNIADSMGTDVCSIYLFRDPETLELCATEGLRAEAVHQTRLRLGEGLVGRVARTGRYMNTADAPAMPGFRFMPETGEEVFPSFLGVPIQRVGEKLGVLVVQSRDARLFSDDEVYGLEVVAMVLAEMTELGAFQGTQADSLPQAHRFPLMLRGTTGQEGAAEGHVWLHEPRVVIANPVGDDPETERARLHEGVERLRERVDSMVAAADMGADGDHTAVLETYRMFAHSRSWLKRMEEDIQLGLSAEAAVEKEQSAARARLEMSADPYLRDR
ncbi:MAG: phosphoenolpyruvate-utilizing N-terminal domain-containing protein, partial [Paracoccus sp. (in: a-proteobacteria)]